MGPILLFPFLRRGNGGTERVKSSPEATQPQGCECRPTRRQSRPLGPGVLVVVLARPGGMDRECRWGMGKRLFSKYRGVPQSSSLQNSILNEGTDSLPPRRSPLMVLQVKTPGKGFLPGGSAGSGLRNTPLPQVTDTRTDRTLPSSQSSLVPSEGPACSVQGSERRWQAVPVGHPLTAGTCSQSSMVPAPPHPHPARAGERCHLTPVGGENPVAPGRGHAGIPASV